MTDKDASEMRILFADRDVVLCVSARRALQQRGYAVTLTHDGDGVIELLARDTFDAIVLGAALPRTSGLEVLRQIKKNSVDAPVILLGDATSEFKRLAESEGAFACLPNPSDDFAQLLDTVNRALAQAARPRAPSAFDETRLMEMLRDLVRSSRAQPLADTLQRLLQASAAAMNAEHAVILLSQEETGLALENALGFSDLADAARDFVTNVGDAFAWRVATERQTLIDHPLRDGEIAGRFIGTPLCVRDQLLGVLVVYPLPQGPIDPARVTWLETFAAQGALVLHWSRLDAENERLSPNDPLTGALKRTVFLDLADHEFRRSWRYNQPLSVILVDVDGMKDINARLGREYGDRVLRAVAGVCRHIVRSIDLVGRYEDDSFALLLLMTDRGGAKSVAERLRDEISSIALPNGRGPARVTATLGVCAYPRENCASIFDLLTITLEAQQAARRSGANRIVYR
jgi:diguanylate cyclase (GGDEF)-like protein